MFNNMILGIKWDLLENTFNRVLVELVAIHPLIDGCLLFHQRGVQLEAADRLDVVVNPQCVRLCFIRHPTSRLEGIFPLYHGCAKALVQGKDTLLSFRRRYPMILSPLRLEITLTLRPIRH